MHTASMHNPSDNPMMAGQPCGQSKPNHSIVCESVRYRMLSVQAESPQINFSLVPSTLLNTIFVEDLLALSALLAAPPGAAAVDSLSRHSPRLSHVVLRI